MPKSNLGKKGKTGLADSIANKYGQQSQGGGQGGGGDAMGHGMRLASALAGEQQSLDEGTRGRLEKALGRSVSDVNVHSGKHSDMVARSLGAEAFAVEKNIFFRDGKLEASSAEGIGLLAHEIMHTGQDTGSSTEARESEARSVENRVAEGERAGGGHELALEQAPPGGGEMEAQEPASGGQSAESDNPDVDEELLERMILERVIELLSGESFEARERFGG